MNEATVMLGKVEVLARFDYEPEDLGHGAYPDYPASVCIQEVQINGVWVDTEPFDPDWIYGAEAHILSNRGRSLKAESDESCWQDQQDRLAERGFP